MPKTLTEMIQEYLIVLEQSDKSPTTIRSNKSSLRIFERWASQNPSFPLNDIGQIKAKHLREFFHYRKVEQNVGAGSRQQNFIHLNSFFKWVAKEYKKDLKKNPLSKVERISYKPPKIQFETEDAIDKVIAVCDGSFEGIRDRLLLLTYKETGARASEILALEEPDYHDVEQYVHIQHGKGGKKRKVPYGDETAIALINYKRVRREHRYAHLSKFFLGQKGPLGYQGMRVILQKRCEEAGIDISHLHTLRHAFVHKAKMQGVTDDALMELMGWSTRTMLDRYGLAMREKRAHTEYREKMQQRKE